MAYFSVQLQNHLWSTSTGAKGVTPGISLAGEVVYTQQKHRNLIGKE